MSWDDPIRNLSQAGRRVSRYLAKEDLSVTMLWKEKRGQRDISNGKLFWDFHYEIKGQAFEYIGLPQNSRIPEEDGRKLLEEILRKELGSVRVKIERVSGKNEANLKISREFQSHERRNGEAKLRERSRGADEEALEDIGY